MRLVLASAMILASSTAFASSITTLGGVQQGSHSIVEKRCAECVTAKAAPEEPSYKVPELTQGTQRTEILEINGEKKLVRTEAWFGGSPVVYVSKVPEWMLQENSLAGKGTPGDGIDTDAKTSAVEHSAPTEAAMPESAAVQKPLAVESFELRTN
jgi:hypothetical protein